MVVVLLVVVLLAVLLEVVSLLNVLWGRSVFAMVLVERGGVRGAWVVLTVVFATALVLPLVYVLVVAEGVRALALLARA